ncbi:hypothetical protein GLOIN_2v831458 [Rhizophagus irregularis DAOM 181602=DAOM 197198]|uniref:Uncharacterized protein n=2 Tax=Rhizophagus irregularis TaxID=588596 RepID=A0A2N1MSP3_9GLOM|nr:hypothetical protein GLOIN_2v831458 [Rhizophagus irregularis DAOM 181602=DAOM 197198]PKK64659.1 hypothetical protein RhiirC2_95835 [Rhizophagus irregularis]POG77054.1 hypothetical protein GLOIN_2v831458 [Rhizophagus irregularis DAOM 181602=DAOM 197198]GET64067.1 hypothetical protein GLOIN_2v831458 [Rhizophagus irregularis DAOM 181602=DAOM 197198]|eukprot:XP_025183920.1 hypothetical protein GLOIN_2v831458 [Rhizophagus irregularis DAOM 181602=DAOM 197198]
MLIKLSKHIIKHFILILRSFILFIHHSFLITPSHDCFIYNLKNFVVIIHLYYILR